MNALLEAILLLSLIAKCNCPSHVNIDDLISTGNSHLDTAKRAARAPANILLFPQWHMELKLSLLH